MCSNKLEQPSILIVTAVDREKDAVLQGIGNHSRVDVLIGGVGPILSAINTTIALSQKKYDVVLNMGIGGGFRSRAEMGSIVIATEMIADEFGIETPSGFRFAEDFHLGKSRIPCDKHLIGRLTSRLASTSLQVFTGPILTVCTVTGTEETANERIKKTSAARAEAMEGFGVALAAQSYQLPVLEIRAISNMVGRRDRSAWKIDEALASLTETSRIIMEVFK